MSARYRLSLFIFRRDLRIHDNHGLNAAFDSSHFVIPCFIINPAQVGKQNAYRSLSALDFMKKSLEELKKDIASYEGKLFIFHGDPETIVETLLSHNSIDAVFVNRDYTPFSQERDMGIEKVCKQYQRDFNSFDDALLNDPESVVNKQNKPYVIFTPFFKASSLIAVKQPQDAHTINFFNGKIIGIKDSSLDTIDSLPISTIPAGRRGGIALLQRLKEQKNYKEFHDFPAYTTTLLSPHNKFGTVSIREVYHAIVHVLGIQHPLIRQLYWRDFFCHVAWHAPHVFGHAFHKEYDSLPWSTNDQHFKSWCEGTTGFPLVDAGMRELNETGFMHNRVRLITSSFLIKDLHINWQWGERYFAQKLVDYDPCVNNGNWQWVASTGCDHQPYFRIFNPWLQQKKFDPECVYIKRWVKELRGVDPTIIHAAYKHTIRNYPEPLIDHAYESKKAKLLYLRRYL